LADGEAEPVQTADEVLMPMISPSMLSKARRCCRIDVRQFGKS
jgi:hypothetical protein